MLSRRRFLGTAAVATALLGLPSSLRAASHRLSLREHLASVNGSPEALARDEAYWYPVQQAFSVDRSLIHLNNGGVCPAPTCVQDAERAHHLEANRRPFYAYEGQIRPQLEWIRQGLADCFGCEAKEIALTRNTSEGMEICQLGFNLQRGDEVLTTEQDYPRMLATWAQRAERDGIIVNKISLPVPLDDPDAFVADLEAAITPRTRLLMCCHMIDLTGQILPVSKITAMAHRHGLPVLVDGAQTFGHVPCTAADLGCDFYATSLHKWMMGPQGTGLLFVRKDRIADLWPLMPAETEGQGDIRKFEDIGTHPPAPFLALGEALTFHQSIGAERKAARLRYLRDYWLDQLLTHDRVRLLTHRPAACSLATIQVDGLDPLDLRNYLWDQHRIRVRPIRHPAVEGIRISPSLYTTLPELDRFVTVMASILRNGLPTT
ncbi:MAG TPA: aminotransferase class V-fold PLP-dependent enzyme [Rhodothermales bacterium]|nr:aminotransferase class V-fold PLP-dependent enzyme [Rhodothermales bacterium]